MGSSIDLSIKGLCRRHGRLWALVDLDLDVKPGTAVLVAGHNGAGKTTFFRVLAGALRPDRGTIHLDGKAADTDALRRATGLLGHPTFCYEGLTALENLQVASRFLGLSTAREAIVHKLAEVGLAERADSPASTFSAGMKKRLSLARTLLQDPALLVLDEPYGALDPPGFELVDRIIRRHTEKGGTVLMASHQLERSSEVCHEGIVLEKGRVVFRGPASEVTAVKGGLQ